MDFVREHADRRESSDHGGLRWGVEPICTVLTEHGLPVAPSTYYEHVAKAPAGHDYRDAMLINEVRRVHAANYGVYRARKVWLALNREGVEVARCTIERLMRQEGLAGAVRGKVKRTTFADPAAPRARDLVRRDFAPHAPDRLWVADITYVSTWSGWVYVGFVIDAFARRDHRLALRVLHDHPTCPRRAPAGALDPSARRPVLGLRGGTHRPWVAGWTQVVVATPRAWRCSMGVRKRQREVQLYRGQIPSPGRPTVAWRGDRVRFWAAIAEGVKTEDACVEAGVSGPVGFRWFRHAGGVNPRLERTVSGRHLSFAEREDIAIWRAQHEPPRRVRRPSALRAPAVAELGGERSERSRPRRV